GPVHINVPFYEPLYETVERLRVDPLQIFPEHKEKVYSEKELQPYAEIWNKARRKIIIVGVLPPNAIQQQFLDKLAGDDSVLVLTETTSNINHPDFFTRIDTLIGPIERSEDAEEQFMDLQPEVLLTFGGMIISKKIKSFLRNYQPKHHWHVDPKKAYNTFFCLNKHFVTAPNAFFNSFLPLVKHTDSKYGPHWKEVKKKRQERHDIYMKEIPYSDLKAMQLVVPAVPGNYNVQLGNSATVRYAQLFKWDEKQRLFCNRGTSGIDGSVSTAVGAAVINDDPTLLICGDLSFIYDSNGLWNNYIPKNFRIIILNNSGGGIFRILPGHKNTENFDTYFETVHDHTAKQISEMYGFDYAGASSSEEIKQQLKGFFETSEKPKILEIFTPRKVNDEVLLEYFSFMKS
ncbi:MAG TPA: thiamine pyrophosphate-dependent enzyme, partial [Gillisia sp.]|nr:thiamine pyrophosphate-dependent enzyme [Gillisia sp.]